MSRTGKWGRKIGVSLLWQIRAHCCDLSFRQFSPSEWGLKFILLRFPLNLSVQGRLCFPTAQSYFTPPPSRLHQTPWTPSHTRQTEAAADLGCVSEQNQWNCWFIPALSMLLQHWAPCAPCFQGNHPDAEHILSCHGLQEALGIIGGFFPPLWGFFWRHQSKIICCTWLTLISIYKYVIPPRSRGDDLNLLQEGGGRGKLIYFYLGWDCCSLGGNEDVTQLWSLRWCFHFDNLEA